MKTERNILIAFILNIGFSIFEFIGGNFTGSVAIMSDAIHDMGDALSIGISYILEKKSKKKPDDKYTYGYSRFSVIGSLITTTILIVGSILVIYNAIKRFINPVEINYNGMIILAIVGAIINFMASYFTREGDSLNQKAVNLHMLEDVLGWVVVLIGAIIMRFTDISIIDPVLSIIVAVYLLANALGNLREIINLFLIKAPKNIKIDELKEHLLKIKGVEDIHHIHLWSLDGYNAYATLHVVTKNNFHEIKEKVREELLEHGICHCTIEIEEISERCHDKICDVKVSKSAHHHHH